MASIPGVRFDITGASGSQGLIGPKDSWKCYVFPRGVYASQDSTGTLITVDTADAASRVTANDWVQVGLSTANVRQVSAVGGNSFAVGTAIIVGANDRVFVIGTTEPTVTGGSATYTVPNTIIRKRDDDTADLYTNSMVTTNSDGLVQFFAATNIFDCMIQDGNQTNQGFIADIECGTKPSGDLLPAADDSFDIGSGTLRWQDLRLSGVVSVDGAAGVTGWATFGSSVTIGGAIGVTGTAAFGSTVTFHGAIGTTGTATFGGLITGSSAFTLSDGSLTITGHIRAQVSLAANAGISTSTNTSILWDVENYDVGGIHDSSTNKERLTIPAGQDGLYIVSLGVHWGATASGFRIAEIRRNASSNSPNLIRATQGHNGTAFVSQSVTAPMLLSATDYVSAVVWQNSGTDLDVLGGSNSYLVAHRIA